ncbi:tetratricopeptide repeat protein [Methylovulum psychrotolerans]|uniref:tetratricopeptide repeat protein n=1 Tax=Methylovulum psychrotolerans TaxID=1704499 RepID=UPI001BFFD58B|nr:tetratricopeptide repeat protein [Methylovulum psychrotolerans]MBT9100014.1 tetratricopeptide repeat protein [Methylovulum psychrotolerans]
MYSLIAFATQWGSKYGGINSFNTDFLTAFGQYYHPQVQTVCLVTSMTEQEVDEANKVNVTLVELPYKPDDKLFTDKHAKSALAELKEQAIIFDPARTVWLGHDRISGAAALEAAKLTGGRSALIHHMSYDAYESFAEDSKSADTKKREQRRLFKQAAIHLAVGPLLKAALVQLADINADQIHQIIPGLAKITPRVNPPTQFEVFFSGRLSDDAAKIKQGHLGVAAFATAIADAHRNNSPHSLQHPKMLLRGVNFESAPNYAPALSPEQLEQDLQEFAADYAHRGINLQALPYTQDREELFDDLIDASVALMPSWHEGFGLVAWEAIAAGVPLIVSKNSGVYELLKAECKGAVGGYVEAINIRGKTEAPYFHDDDLAETAKAIKTIADNFGDARSRAAQLRDKLSHYTWQACVSNVAQHFGWDLPNSPSTPPSPNPNTTPANHKPASPLRMPSKRWQANSGMPESQLLRADEALVPFDAAQQPSLDLLIKWLDAEWPTAVRLLTGAGGLGKTRLALELCRQRQAAGWCCGFLDKDHAAKDMALFWDELRQQQQAVLVVLDYAETRQTVLLALVKALLQNPSPHPVRLLLLARGGGEWWDNLPGKDADCETLLASYATSGPYLLPALYLDASSRRLAYQQALQAYAVALGRPATQYIPDLTGEHFAKPLYLQMAALLALFNEYPQTAEGLTRALLNHERRYWAQALANSGLPNPENLAQQLLALATLAGGFAASNQAHNYWGAVSDYPLQPLEMAVLFNALTPLYPGSGNQRLPAMQPDLLGEALVAQTLLQAQGARLLDAVLREDTLQYSALTVLARLSGHRPDVEGVLVEGLMRNFGKCCLAVVEVVLETPGKLTALACAVFRGLTPAGQSHAAGLLLRFFKHESVELGYLAYEVALSEKNKADKKLAKKPKDISAKRDYAKSLDKLSITLHRIGKDAEAVGCSEEAVAIYERLAGKNPDRFEPDYVHSLSNYSIYLSGAGQNAEALGFAQQALAICKRLAEKNPDRFEPDYARSLNNYATRLSGAGQYAEAQGFAEEAVAIRKRLAEKNPDRFEPDYADSLHSYANRLSDAGQYAEAQGFAQQALAIRKRLADKNPDRFEPDYADSLHNYAIRLSEAGQYAEAQGFAQQALAIRGRLAVKTPARYEFEAYNSYCNARFLHWLAEAQPVNGGWAEPLAPLPSAIAAHQQALLKFYAAVVQTCLAVSPKHHSEEFQQALAVWQALAPAQQNRVLEYYLCAWGWLNHHEPTALTEPAGAEVWRRFCQQRQGRLPHRLHTVAERLDFTWPDDAA